MGSEAAMTKALQDAFREAEKLPETEQDQLAAAIRAELQLREQQRVRLIIEPIEPGQDSDRAAALNRLRAGIASMAFSSSGGLPTRDELHDRS